MWLKHSIHTHVTEFFWKSTENIIFQRGKNCNANMSFIKQWLFVHTLGNKMSCPQCAIRMVLKFCRIFMWCCSRSALQYVVYSSSLHTMFIWLMVSADVKEASQYWPNIPVELHFFSPDFSKLGVDLCWEFVLSQCILYILGHVSIPSYSVIG